MQRSLIDHRGKVLAEIEGLKTLDRERLNQRWRELFAAERPPRVCGELLIKALAYRLQEKALGGLKPATRRLLESWGRKHSVPGSATPPLKTRLKAGTVLVREWHGTAHRVTVVEDDGYRFDGKRYRSLSEVARTITGSRWSGPLFFGLKATAEEKIHGAE
jgi:DUF2924 family protein